MLATDTPTATFGCNDCRLSSLCLPVGFSHSELTQIGSVITQRPLLQKDNYLYREHDAFSAIYVIRSGCVKTSVLTETGQEKITGFYLPGDIVGIGGISDQHYHSSAIAMTTTSLCQIHFDDIETLSAKLPDLQRYIFKIMSRKIVMDQQTMLILNQKKAEARIAAYLLSLSARFERQRLSPTQWTLPMSRGELGNFLGLTIESVSRTLTRFRKQQVMSIDKRHVTINDVEQLQAIAELDTTNN